MARFQWNDKKILNQVDIASSKAMVESCELLTDTIKKSMKAGSYAEYPSNRKDGTKHGASKPWDSPAPDTEKLKGSISYHTSDGKSGGLSSPASGSDAVKPPGRQTRGSKLAVIGSAVKYAEYLEDGTSKMFPRPYLRPALAKSFNKIMSIFSKNFRKIIK